MNYWDENGKFIDRLYNSRGTTTLVGGEFNGMKANIITGPQIETGYIMCQVPHETIKNRGYLVMTLDGSKVLSTK